MTRISIGKTAEEAVISIETSATKLADLEPLFSHFSERDKFDALMALRYLAVSEIRKNSGDITWLKVINLALTYLGTSLGDQTIDLWSTCLSLTSAFAARDYGKSLVFSHFRYL